MFRNRNDHLGDLIDHYKSLDSSETSDSIDIPTSSKNILDHQKRNLKTEIETFSKEMTEGMLSDNKTLDISFCAKIINFDPKLFGMILWRSIYYHYKDIGFTKFLQIIDDLNNLHSYVEGYQSLFNEIIIDGSKYRRESIELSKRLKNIDTLDGSDQLSDEQKARIARMIERLEPFAVPLVKKICAHEAITLTEEELDIGMSYPIFSKSGNHIENHLIMGAIIDSFKEQEKKYKALLNKK